MDVFEALQGYQAARVVIDDGGGDPRSREAEGGGLADAFERLGRDPLRAALAEVRGVRLEDGDLVVEAERGPEGGRLRVRWGDQVAVDEPLALDTGPAGAGPWFRPDPDARVHDPRAALRDPSLPLYVASSPEGGLVWATAGQHGPGLGALSLRGAVAPVGPGELGSASFRAAHGVRWAYLSGAMAGGIGSADIVLSMARAGLLGFFGAGGVPLEGVERALQRITAEVGEGAWGFNLLHNPAEPAVEEATVDLYLRYGVPRVSASAYMGLTPAVVRYRLAGIRREGGRIACPNQVLAKVSRPEVAEKFLRPAPDRILERLRDQGHLTDEQVALARQVPIAEDITAEADSGGHTDGRPLVVLLPVLQRLRDRVAAEQGYAEHGIDLRVGAAGGIGTPAAAWAAFALGADYVLTGSVNQAAVEAGTSPVAKEMLADASFTDVTTGPAPDMFEIGAKVQVLSRGTMYANRAQRLYDLYREYDSLDAIPAKERQKIEKQIFRAPLEEVWEGTRAYWQERDPEQVAKAERDPHHQMALTFRWYLGMTSRWARTGDDDRKRDFQMWCGPAMGAFNHWAAGTPLEPVGERTVVGIATALMRGAAVHARIAQARAQGLPLPAGIDAVGVV